MREQYAGCRLRPERARERSVPRCRDVAFVSPGTVETARSGPPRYDMHIQLPQDGGDARREYALSAFRHQDRAEDGGPSADGGCHYNVRPEASLTLCPSLTLT